jgi:hypothetical protein
MTVLALVSETRAKYSVVPHHGLRQSVCRIPASSSPTCDDELGNISGRRVLRRRTYPFSRILVAGIVKQRGQQRGHGCCRVIRPRQLLVVMNLGVFKFGAGRMFLHLELAIRMGTETIFHTRALRCGYVSVTRSKFRGRRSLHDVRRYSPRPRSLDRLYRDSIVLAMLLRSFPPWMLGSCVQRRKNPSWRKGREDNDCCIACRHPFASL